MTQAQTPDPIPGSLADTLYPLDGADPTLPPVDLDALREMVGEAKMVALGEPTHGQREVFQLKHRTIAWLVEELNFTTFAIEASVTGCRAMSRFVLTGEGDPVAAVKAQGFWTWATEEVLELILWLREWNIAHPEHQVDVAGVDTQEARSAHAELTTMLINHDPQFFLDQIITLADIASIVLTVTPYNADQHHQLTAELDTVEERIPDLTGVTQKDIDQGLDDVLAMRQFLTLWAATPGAGYTNTRDRIMADRATALAYATPTSRVALWAHNAHVSMSHQAYWNEKLVPMGLNLKARLVDDVVIAGILFGSGDYQAMELMTSGGYQLNEIEVGPAPAGSLDTALFDASMAPASLLDLRTLPSDLHAWLSAPHISRAAGSVAMTSDEMERSLNVTQCFDVIAFVRETTRARPL